MDPKRIWTLALFWTYRTPNPLCIFVLLKWLFVQVQFGFEQIL